MDHGTGKGYVAKQHGHYRDALSRGQRVVPMIVEAQGGITPHALAYIGYLAKRAKGKGARDTTRYGTSRTSARGFFGHWSQRISLKAMLGDARAIRKSIVNLKRRAVEARRASGSSP